MLGVTLMQKLHCKGSTYCGYSDNMSHVIIFRCGVETVVLVITKHHLVELMLSVDYLFEIIQ